MWKHCGSCIEQVHFTRFYYLYFMASLIHELPRSCFPSFVLTLQARVRFCPVSATKCQPGQSSEHATTPAAPASGTESPAERTWEQIESVDSSNHYCPKRNTIIITRMRGEWGAVVIHDVMGTIGHLQWFPQPQFKWVLMHCSGHLVT